MAGDFDAIHTCASDPDVTRFMFHGVRTAADTRDYLGRMIASQTEAPRRTCELAVVLTSVEDGLRHESWTSHLSEIRG